MNSIRKDYTKPRGGRALNWTTRIEEPGSGVRIARTLKVVVSGSALITDYGEHSSSQIEIL